MNFHASLLIVIFQIRSNVKKLLSSQNKMTEKETSSLCGFANEFGIPVRDNSAAHINEALVAAVNIPFYAFAFLSNLAIIVTIIKTPSLQRPCNILLCSLAATDCLTGITAQPIFVALRLMILHRANSTCSYQDSLFTSFYVTIMLTSGCSFAFLTAISFDRQYALSRPLEYRATVTSKCIFVVCLFVWHRSFWLL